MYRKIPSCVVHGPQPISQEGRRLLLHLNHIAKSPNAVWQGGLR